MPIVKPRPIRLFPSQGTLERRLRRSLRRLGFYLAKSRSRTPEHLGYSGYWVTDNRNHVVFGAHPHEFSATLEDIEEWLRE